MRYFIVITMILSIISCSEIPPEIPDIDISGEKVVLVEDFTGIKCTNCPTAAAELSNISVNNPEKLITVAIHAPKYSAFTKPHSSSKYDFRIEKADQIVEKAGVIEGLPSSSFDRYDLDLGDVNGKIVGKVENYVRAFQATVSREAQALISIEHSYMPETREISAKINVSSLETLDEDLFVTLYLLESHLIDYQIGKVDAFPEYEHNHVLRDVITQVEGDFISSGLAKDQIVSKELKYTIPTPSQDEDQNQYIPENMELVAFVHYNTGNKREVIQSTIVNVIE